LPVSGFFFFFFEGVELVVLSTANSMVVQFRRKQTTRHEQTQCGKCYGTVTSSSSKLSFSSVSLQVLISSVLGRLVYRLVSWACSYWWFREAGFDGGWIECLG